MVYPLGKPFFLFFGRGEEAVLFKKAANFGVVGDGDDGQSLKKGIGVSPGEQDFDDFTRAVKGDGEG